MPDTRSNLTTPTAEPPQALSVLFTLFNEIGILSQLSSAMLEARLPAGVLISQFGVINHLGRGRDGSTPLKLARAFQVPKTTMTHTLGLLERHAWIIVMPNPKDKRSKCVWLTSEGRKFHANAIKAMDPDFVALAEKLDLVALAQILPVLQDLRSTLDEMRD
jgi:DNA-binding MarR family transcriptional regulator